MKQFFVLTIFNFPIIYSLSIATKSKTHDKLYLLLGHETFDASLDFNPISIELINTLPMKINLNLEKDDELKISNQSLKYIPLATKIESTKNSETFIDKTNKGDVMIFNGTYLVLCNEDQVIKSNNNKYVKIGNINNMKNLFESFKNQKKLVLWNRINYDNYKGQVVPYDYYIRLINYLTWKSLTFVCFLLI